MISGELPSVSRLAAAMAGLVILGLLAACGQPAGDPARVTDLVRYRQDIAAWDAQRVAGLKGEHGYLNLAGLFWLDEGAHRMGSAPGTDIRLPAGKAAPLVGTITVSGRRASFVAADGVDVRRAGAPVHRLALADDGADQPDLLTHGSLAWFIIRRAERLGVRLRDYEHRALETFPGIERFPVDPRWRVTARLERYAEPRQIAVATVVDGLAFEPISPGVLKFALDGERYALEAYGAAGDEALFIVFADATSGAMTYGAGRFLTAPWPDGAGRTVLDFNRAYNPPCAFNDYATCPIAPLHNRLPVAIQAGEKYAPQLHVAGS